MTPLQALAHAVTQLNDAGRFTPCASDPERWIGDDPQARAFAVFECVGSCPVLFECRSAGLLETHGVWGGIDRSKRTRRSRSAVGPAPPTTSPFEDIPNTRTA